MRGSMIRTSSFAFFGAVLAACGGDDDGGTPSGSDTGAAVDSTPSDSATSDTTATDTPTTDSATSDTSAVDSTAADTPTDAPIDAASDVATACTPTADIRLKLNTFAGGTIPDTASATASLCSTGAVVLGTTRKTFAVPVGANVFFTGDAGDTFWPAASIEWNRPAGSSGDEALDVAAKTNVPLPDYDATKAALIVQLNAPTGAACDASGFVVTVPGHSEAKVQYTTGGALTIDATLTATAGARGSFAIIQKITPGAPVTVLGTRTGCDLNFKLTPLCTGNVPLVAGKVVHAVANVIAKP